MTPREDQTTEMKSPVSVGTVVDGYRVERIISVRAGQHTLAEATAPSGERVTLKLLDAPLEGKDLRRRAAKLARVHASVAHPHVLPLLDGAKSRERFCLGSVPANAVTLADRLREGPLKPKEAVTLLSQVAGALETARRRGLVHRAFTPASVIVTKEKSPQALLTDFGIAVPDAPGCERGESVADADYRSPEEIRGEPPTPASTVYSLACILVACLTGSPPYPYYRPLLAVHAHLVEAPPRLSERNPDLPKDLDEVVVRALAKNPDERYGSPVALMRAVQRSLGMVAPIPGPAAPKRQETPRPEKRAAPAPASRPEPKAAPRPEPKPAPAAPEPKPAPPAPTRKPPPPAPEPKPAPVAKPARDTAEPAPAARSRPPKRARRWRRRERGARHQRAGGRSIARGMAPTWAGIALIASALAGFATGNGNADDRKAKVTAAPAPVEQAPRPVAQSPEPTVGPVVNRLEKRRAAARRRLRAARRPAGQALVATNLARVYRDARKSLLRSSGTTEQERRLAKSMRGVERAYARLARAPRRGSRAWRLASAEVLKQERELELLLRTHSWI
jgi:serine/threonine protein kinase